jgi:pyruvate dehydrogenase kinase 2/3/4
MPCARPHSAGQVCPWLQVRDWYVESFRELKSLPPIKDTSAELQFTDKLKQIYQRHAHVVPTMARCA